MRWYIYFQHHTVGCRRYTSCLLDMILWSNGYIWKHHKIYINSVLYISVIQWFWSCKTYFSISVLFLHLHKKIQMGFDLSIRMCKLLRSRISVILWTNLVFCLRLYYFIKFPEETSSTATWWWWRSWWEMWISRIQPISIASTEKRKKQFALFWMNLEL